MAEDGASGVDHFVVELNRNGDAVTGSVRAHGQEALVPFTGWLELLALLEARHVTAETSDD